MQAKSIDELLEGVSNWHRKNISQLSEAARKDVAGIPFDLQQADDRRDYEKIRAIALRGHDLFSSYRMQLEDGNLDSLAVFPVGTTRDAKSRIKQRLMEEFLAICNEYIELFVSAAQKTIESRLSGSANQVTSYKEMVDNGVYLVISPVQRNIRLVNRTYRSNEVKVGLGNGQVRLSVPAIMEISAQSVSIGSNGRLRLLSQLNPSQIHVETITRGFVYRMTQPVRY